MTFLFDGLVGETNLGGAREFFQLRCCVEMRGQSPWNLRLEMAEKSLSFALFRGSLVSTSAQIKTEIISSKR